MACLKTYTVAEVKAILSYSEGAAPPKINVETAKVKTLHGELTIALSSNEKTGHAQERHLVITEKGLEDRTLGDDGLPLASAFLSDKLNNLIYVITALLNCQKGQEALAAMDAYEFQGKTRVVIVEEGSVLGCGHINARVFYKGGSKQKVEPLVRAAMVLDSNHGGKYPFKIVTAFPCKEDPFLQVTLSDVMVQCRDLSKAGHNPLHEPVMDLLTKAKHWVKKSSKKIPNDLLHGSTFVLGEIFSSGWIKPNPALYKYKYPPTVDADADDRPDKKPAYEMVPNGKPTETRMSIPLLLEQGEKDGLKILEVDARKKMAIFLLT